VEGKGRRAVINTFRAKNLGREKEREGEVKGKGERGEKLEEEQREN
jgi:hypothetical protein